MTIFVECHCGMFSGITPPPPNSISQGKANIMATVASKTEQCYRIPHSIFKTFHWTTMKLRDWSFIHEWTDNL